MSGSHAVCTFTLSPLVLQVCLSPPLDYWEAFRSQGVWDRGTTNHCSLEAERDCWRNRSSHSQGRHCQVQLVTCLPWFIHSLVGLQGAVPRSSWLPLVCCPWGSLVNDVARVTRVDKSTSSAHGGHGTGSSSGLSLEQIRGWDLRSHPWLKEYLMLDLGKKEGRELNTSINSQRPCANPAGVKQSLLWYISSWSRALLLGHSPRQRKTRTAGRRRTSLSRGWASLLVVQCRMVSPETIYTQTSKADSAGCIHISM